MPETSDPTFYRSPAAAIAAPPESLAYVAAFDPAGEKRDAMAVTRLETRRGRIIDTYVDGAISKVERDRRLRQLDDEAEKLAAEKHLAQIPSAIDWTNTPQSINGVLTAMWREVVLDEQLQRSGGFVVGPQFTLADVVLGLSAHRWRATPIERPALPAVELWLSRLAERALFDELAVRGEP